MDATEYFRAGRLREAIAALKEEVRRDPANMQRRTFLFELLCFDGDYDRAEKQLDVLAQDGKNAALGAMMYRAALHAERARQAFFANREYAQQKPVSALGDVGCTLNGRSYQSIVDADPRIGPRLEVFAAGSYMWIPFEQITSIEMQAPRRLRDTLWAPAIVRTGPELKATDLGEIVIPVLSPASSQQADEQVRLGRSTIWSEQGDAVVPFGQKLFLADDEEIPLLDIRSLQFTTASAALAS